MILTLLGILLILIPFLLIFRFNNRFLGFTYILGVLLVIHIFIGFLTQFFHVFLYPVVIIIHSIIALVTLYVLRYKSPLISFKLKFNWFAIFSFLIILFQLWSVHFFYTGSISTINGNQTVSNGSYPYPYFSDEWIGISFSNYSISNNALPVVNPLSGNSKFPNIFIFFFSLISELFLVLSISPLLGYVYFSIFTGFIICLLVFILLRIKNINIFPSLLASLFIPYIVNGLNLPGIWYLLPYTGGLIFFLLSLIGLLSNKSFFAYLMSFISLLLYPPIIVFVIPTILINIIFNKNFNFTKKIKIILISFIAIILIATFIIFSQSNSINSLFNILINSIWRLNLDGGIPNLYIWNIMPLIVIPFSFFGLIKILNKKNLIILTPVIIGLTLWFIYTYSQSFFIIDYARVVIITSILLILLAGIGFGEISKKILEKYQNFFKKRILIYFKIFLIIIFFISSFYYTDSSRWKNLKLKVIKNEKTYYFLPSAPASEFLKQEDLNLFNSISKQKFISPAWKGLTIGVATLNYPMDSKASIITNSYINYNEFVKKTCEDKIIDLEKRHIKYVYSSEFNCDNFIYIGQNSEGLYLYKYNN